MSTLDTQLQLRASGPASPRLRVVWAALLALATLASFAVLLTTRFSAEEGEFTHALRSGEITSVAVGHSADFYSASGFNTTGSNANDDIAVSWVNRFGFRREAVLYQLGGTGPRSPRPPHRPLDWTHRPPSLGRHTVSERSPPRWCNPVAFV